MAKREPQSIRYLHRRRTPFTGIYFIQGTETKNIKIGFSKNVVRRVAQIAGSRSEEIKFVGAMAATRPDEWRVQKRFEHIRVRGEWFEPHPDLTTFIADQTQGLAENNPWLYPEV